MKIQLTENQYNKLLNESIERQIEEDYPTSWDIEKFKSLKTFKERINYCENNLIRISSGSSRIVYKIDDEKVLKLAKNRKGIAQNNVEIIYGNYYDIQSIIATVFDYDNDDLWVEMELARKVTPTKFKEVTGVSFDDYRSAMYYHESSHISRNNRYREPDNMDDMWENEFVVQMIDFMTGYDLPVGDLCKLSSFGLVNRDGDVDIVMVDYGLTNEVYTSYYD